MLPMTLFSLFLILPSLHSQLETLTSDQTEKYLDQLDYSMQGLISQDPRAIGFCDSSWAIATAFLYEYYLRQQYYKGQVSENAIIQCTTYYSPLRRKNDCSGGRFQDALSLLAKVGAVSKDNHPSPSYSFNEISATSPSDPICTDHRRLFVGKGTVRLYQSPSSSELKTILRERGPLVVQIRTNSDFLRYSDGQFSNCTHYEDNSSEVTVMLFGFKGNQYWLIKGPFGPQWGYRGTMKVSMQCPLGKKMGHILFEEGKKQEVRSLFDPTQFYTQTTPHRASSRQSVLELYFFILVVVLGLSI